MIEHANGRPCSGRRCQPVLVVLEEQAPRVRIAADELQHGLPGTVDERLIPESPGEEIEGFPGFLQTALGEASLVQGEAADQMTAQGSGGPLAEADAPLGIDPVADRDDGVQVKMLEGSSNPAPALGLNYQEILGSCLCLQLPAGEYVAQVHLDVRRGGAEDLRHLPLGQPDRLPVEADIHTHFPTRCLVDQDLAVGAGCGGGAAHLIGLGLNPGRARFCMPGYN